MVYHMRVLLSIDIRYMYAMYMCKCNTSIYTHIFSGLIVGTVAGVLVLIVIIVVIIVCIKR